MNQITVAGLPKADIHMHAETAARVERLLSRREGRVQFDWRDWQQKVGQTPPGITRLEQLHSGLKVSDLDRVARESVVEWVSEAFNEAANDGAVLAEMRFGSGWARWPDLMHKFREAERQAQAEYPEFCAEAVISGVWPGRPDGGDVFAACLDARSAGLAGIDFVPMPYSHEADRRHWDEAYAWAETAARVGLGITVHAGEFSPANIRRAAHMPHVRRIGHAVHAGLDLELLDELQGHDITVECCLTSNLTLGAVPSLNEHPIGKYLSAGLPVALCSDNPVRMSASIGGEYKLAAGLGFGESDLLGFTKNGIEASFTSDERKEALLARIEN